MPSDPKQGQKGTGLTFADVALQAAVLAYVIDSAPDPVSLAELPVVLFEGRFSPEEEEQTLRAAESLLQARLLERKGDAVIPAPPPAALARAANSD